MITRNKTNNRDKERSQENVVDGVDYKLGEMRPIETQGTKTLNFGEPPHFDALAREVEYSLRVATNSTNLKVISLIPVSEKTRMVSTFISKYCNSDVSRRVTGNVIEGWIDVRDLESQHGCVQTTLSKGFQIPKNGLRVYTNQDLDMVLGHDTMQTSDADSFSNSLLYQKVIRCLFYTQKSFLVNQCTLSTPPTGYDSLYYESHTSFSEAVKELSEHQEGLIPVVELGDDVDPSCSTVPIIPEHFIVFDAAKIIPHCVVEFTVDPMLEAREHQRKLEQLCEGCQSQRATCWCEVDECRLCNACDISLHNHPLTQRHKRVALSDLKIKGAPICLNDFKAALASKCSEHEKTVEYYCEECLSSICVDCKISGSHFKGSKADHPLIPLQHIYKRLCDLHNKPEESDRTFQSYMEKLDCQTNLIVSCLTQTVESEMNKLEQIKQHAQKASEKVKALFQLKRRILHNDLASVRRQIADNQRIMNHVVYSARMLPSTSFISVWRGFNSRREENTHSNVHTIIATKSDIVLSGQLEVNFLPDDPAKDQLTTNQHPKDYKSDTERDTRGYLPRTEMNGNQFNPYSNETLDNPRYHYNDTTLGVVRAPEMPHIRDWYHDETGNLNNTRYPTLDGSVMPELRADIPKSSRNLPLRSVVESAIASTTFPSLGQSLNGNAPDGLLTNRADTDPFAINQYKPTIRTKRNE